MRRKTGTRDAGQGLVEFALVLPVFFLVVFAVIDLGRVIWANDALANAAREGARYGSVEGTSPLTAGGTSITTVKQAIRDRTLQFAWAGGQGFAVTVCYSGVHVSSGQATGCSGDIDESGATNTRGSLVTVTVSSTVRLVTGSFLGLPDFGVSATSTVLVNN